MSALKAPFPWFGGKSRAADIIWSALGDVGNYVEPFAGSLAVLLTRPHAPQIETVNDKDQYVANFWRALSRNPAAVSKHADWPVNEADLSARHAWLVTEGRERLTRLAADPDFYDAKVAGWWVWGQCAWIGSGWCSGTGPWRADNGALVRGNAGQGINRKLPHLGNAGQGIREYLSALADRLRRVRVCCGDWSRVVTPAVLRCGATAGVLLDPPYLASVRQGDLYSTDDDTVAHSAREWAIENGSNPRLRIVLCGYEEEHRMPRGWRMVKWTAKKAYGSTNGNRHRERLWLSPHCLDVRDAARRAA
jgi:DNA adenine methylase